MSFPAYPTHKDSGSEWIGEIPDHWSASPLKRAFKIEGGSTPPPDEANWDGDIAWVTPADLSGLSSLFLDASKRTITIRGLASCGTTLLPAGSLILSTRAPIGSLAIGLISMCTNQGCKGLVPNTNASAAYFAFVLLTAKGELNNRGRGTTFLEISGDELSRFIVPTPPFVEQTQIARFLDHETARIDALIEEQHCLIELLKEKCQAVISHAVTKGLDPSVPMKDSGVEWLGEVPAHWDISRLKYHSSKIGDGLHATPEYDDEGDYFFINGNNLVDGCIVTNSTTRKINYQEFLKHRVELDTNTVLISINGTIGNLALYRNEPVILGKSAAYINCTESLSRLFCLYLFSSEQIKRFFESQLTGTTIYNLSLRAIAETPTPLPSLVEQISIVNFLNQRIAEFDELIDNAEQLSKLLQERRSALISAAVTGKIDVRDWQPTAGALSHELELEAV